MEPKGKKNNPGVDVTGYRSKVWCCKEQYCIGTWNVRYRSQGKLEVFKQEMARVNIDILGISDLKWTGMGEFNSDDHYIYDCGQCLQRSGVVAIKVNKSLKSSTWMQPQKWQRDCCLFPRKTIQYQLSSVQSSRSVMSDSLQPHEPQHTRPPCPSQTPGVYPNPCPSSHWCHPAISSSVVPFSSCPQSFPASGSFHMSQFFASGNQSIGVSASTSDLPMNIQNWFPLGWTGWISLQSKGLSRVFNTLVQKHQFFGVQLSL